jgi:hypothetical protein
VQQRHRRAAGLLGLHRIVGRHRHRRGQAAAARGCQRALPQIIERGGHHRAPGKFCELLDVLGDGQADRVRRLDRVLDDRVGDHVPDEGDRVEQAPGGGQARDRLARVREHQVSGQGVGQADPAGRIGELTTA